MRSGFGYGRRHEHDRRADSTTPSATPKPSTRAPTHAARQGRGGRGVYGRQAQPVRVARSRRGRRPRHQERGRRRHRGRDSVARHLAAAARHDRDHPHPPHRLRHADVQGRRREGPDRARDRHPPVVRPRGVPRGRCGHPPVARPDPGQPVHPQQERAVVLSTRWRRVLCAKWSETQLPSVVGLSSLP